MIKKIAVIPTFTVKAYWSEYYHGPMYHLYINGVLEQCYFDKKSLMGRINLLTLNEINTLDADIDFPNSSVKGGNADNTGTDVNDLFSNF